MAFYRMQSQFCRHVIAPCFYYLGVAFLLCLLIFAYFLLKNALTFQPRSVKVVEVGLQPDEQQQQTSKQSSSSINNSPPAFIKTSSLNNVITQQQQKASTPAPPIINQNAKPKVDEDKKPAEGKSRKNKRTDRGEPGSDSYYVIEEQLNTVVKINKTAYKSRTCSAITGRRIVMNYAHNCCKHSQPKNCDSALQNGFDICIQFTQASVDAWFVEHNKKVFEAHVMAGYGIWKAYLIMRVLITLDDDDVLFYSDSGAVFLGSAEDYFCLMDERQQDAVVFSVGLPENEYTKGDAFLVAGVCPSNIAESDDCEKSQQRMGGYSMYRKSMYAFNFLSHWLTFNSDLRIVSDERSSLAKDKPKFKANRHDQTALSLSSKRCGLPEWPDPSQWGAEGYNKMLREKPEFKKIAKTIIDCTRDKS